MKIALIINDNFSMYHFRKGLIRQLVRQGNDVSIIVPQGEFTKRLEELGARVIITPMERFFSPLADIRLALSLLKIFKAEAFGLVHNMTAKPNIYGSLAAYAAGVPRIVCLVSGAGFAFQSKTTLREKMLKTAVIWLYRMALSLAHKTWFQNQDDLQYFIHNKIIAPDKGIVIRSGGINTYEFSPERVTDEAVLQLKTELKIPSEAHCVLMVAARLIWSKGVREFIEAAQQCIKSHQGWYFIMICPKDPGSPDHVPDQYLAEQRSDRLIIIDTFQYNIEVFEAMADIIVLPSYYREGVPRTLLEGLSMGKPIITTDHTGCREVVDDNQNGFLIPVQDPKALADRLEILMSDPLKRIEFGQRSRNKAINEFDEDIVVRNIFRELYGITVHY